MKPALSPAPRSPDFFKARLARLEGLAHVTIEVDPASAVSSVTADAVKNPGGFKSRHRYWPTIASRKVEPEIDISCRRRYFDSKA